MFHESRRRKTVLSKLTWVFPIATAIFITFGAPASFARESQAFIDKIAREHGLNPEQRERLSGIILRSGATRNIGTEDPNEIFGPNNSAHPASRRTCQERVLQTGLIRANPNFERHCGAKWMAPIGPHNRVCVDQFEFPNIPCEYPLVWVSSSQASRICQSMGKRLCNSHEWEGACSGRMKGAAEAYRFELGDRQTRRSVINQSRDLVWAFSWNRQVPMSSDERAPILSSVRSPNTCGIFNPNDPDFDDRIKGRVHQFYSGIGTSRACNPGVSPTATCGSNTWPAGMKYLCRTEAGVYDLHGNVAEVVNFPLTPQGIAVGSVTDVTERKGSFFVSRSGYPDDCLVRQPYEHMNRIATDGHSFYQEGFRCCKDVSPAR